MANKQDQLVQAILEQNQSLNATQLANRLGVSVRTVHNYLNKINSEYPGAISSTPKGYQISPKIARKILHSKSSEIPQTAAERCNYVLNRLVQNSGSLNLYDLCDEIYISTTTFRSLLGRMRRLTREYDLTLTVSSDTVSLTGTERNKRRLLSSLLYRESSTAFTSIDALQEAFPTIDMEKIRADVVDVLNECHYFINDYSLFNLLLHIAITIHCLSNGCDNRDQIPKTVQMSGQEQDLARKVISRLEKSFSISFSPVESYELALLLISRASALDYQSITMENLSIYIGQDCVNLVQRLIQNVQDFYAIDLSEPEFFIRFALHIHNLLIRANAQSLCKNPLTAEIRQTCPLIYDVSVQLSGIIMEQTGITIDEDEIAYIALHLGGALETQKELASRIPAVLYCPSYYDMDSSLADRINRHLNSKILLTDVFTNENDLESIPPNVLAICTVRLHRVWDLPMVLISPFLTNTDCIAIRRKVEEMNLTERKKKFRQNLESIMSPELFECSDQYLDQKSVIHYMCGRLQTLGYTGSKFEKEVMEREAVSSTAFGQFAIPHTLKMNSRKTGLYVYISRSPILWGDSMVNLIIMLSFNPNERKIFYDIFEPLSMILSDPNRLKTALSCQTYDEFINFLLEYLE